MIIENGMLNVSVQYYLKEKLGLFGEFLYAFSSFMVYAAIGFAVISKGLGKLLLKACRVLVRLQIRFDRFVVKRYLLLETPLYKVWWHFHKETMQRKLDEAHHVPQFNKSRCYE